MLVFLPLTFPVFAYLIETPSRVRFIIHVHLDLSVFLIGFEVSKVTQRSLKIPFLFLS